MSDRGGAARWKVVRVACVLVLAAMAAGCDRCGYFVPPISFEAGPLDVCRDEAPRPR